MALGGRLLLIALLIGGAPPVARGAEASPGAVRSLIAPPRPHRVTRIFGVVRPFFNLIGSGGGAIVDVAVDHYFDFPLKIGAEIAPAALAVQAGGGGAITHLRLEGAFVSDYLEAGLAVGGRTENLGAGGLSLAARVRLGALDGLNLRLTYGYAVVRNRYTAATRVAFSNVVGVLEVPLAPRLALVVDGGFSFDVWLYGTLGLKHTLRGGGGPGTWIVRGGFGLAWVLDRFPCQYSDPDRCQGSAWGVGPTISFGLERRF